MNRTTTTSFGTRLRGLARRVRGIWASLRLLFNPSRLNAVFEIDDAVSSRESEMRIADHARKSARGRTALEARPRIGALDRAALRALPEGTVGRTYADFLDRNGLDPSAIPTHADDDDASYVRAHLYETHDLW